METRFSEYFQAIGIDLTEEEKGRFDTYLAFLREYNEKVNLTAIVEKEDVIKKHFVDSLVALPYLDKNASLLDVGSGGGFPALPIRIMRPDINLTMVEATGKKCEFLKQAVVKLNLENVSVLNARAEDLAKDKKHREQYDVVTARAVAPLNTLSEYCLPFVKVGGKFLALKGDASEEIKEAKNALFVLGGKIVQSEPFTLFDSTRTVVVVEKIKETPATYPRGNGKERKKPL